MCGWTPAWVSSGIMLCMQKAAIVCLFHVMLVIDPVVNVHIHRPTHPFVAVARHACVGRCRFVIVTKTITVSWYAAWLLAHVSQDLCGPTWWSSMVPDNIPSQLEILSQAKLMFKHDACWDRCMPHVQPNLVTSTMCTYSSSKLAFALPVQSHVML